MTNKTELLPCPCCAGEANEMYTYLSGVEWVACLKCGLETKGFSNSKAAAQPWNARPAPAEDVRAVGEEPVAWLVNGTPFTDAQSAQAFLGFSNYEVVPLYRHPQRPEVTGQCSEHLCTQGRPVVLPERRELSTTGRVYLSDLDCEWNACIDEFERLNK